MAQHETREIASYLRDGSLWVGHFVASSGDLYFGDDRFDGMHGLARLVRAQASSSANEAAPQAHAWNRFADSTVAGKTSTLPTSAAAIERLKRAA